MDTKGHIVNYPMAPAGYTQAQKINACRTNDSAHYYCYNALADNNWKMDY